MDNSTAIGASYFIALSDAIGQPLRDIDDFLSVTYTKTLNGVGACELVLSADFPLNLLKVDGRIGIYRTIRSNKTYLDGETIYMIRRITRTLDRVVVMAFTPAFILGGVDGQSGRFVAFDSTTAQSDKSGAADDIMKQFIRDSLTSIATGRDVTSSVAGVDLSAFITVEVNKSEGVSMEKGAARRNILRVIQEIADATVTQTPRIYFDFISPTSDSAIEFRTYKNLRGTDRTASSASPTLFNNEDGTLTDVELTLDYSNEWTSAIIGGRGEASSRTVATAQDTTRINVSPFGYRERFQNANYITATGATETAQLQTDADALLRRGRPRVIFTGTIVDTPFTQYGIAWTHGDKVTCTAFGETFDCIIESVEVSVSGGRENIRAYVRAEEGGDE